MNKDQKIDRVFEGLKKINKEALKTFESKLGREIHFEEYVEKYMEDVTSNYLKVYVDTYTNKDAENKK